MKYFIGALFICSLLSGTLLTAQRLEAERATLAGGATVQSSSSASNGKYVSQNGGSLSFSVSIPTEGYYEVFINAAAPSGSKINVFLIDANSIEFTSSAVDFTTTKIVGALKLTAGNHTFQIQKSWGYINIDYLELKAVSAGERFDTGATLVTSQSTDHTAKLYQFLFDNYGHKIISGVMTLNSMDEVNWLKGNTGKEPALVGLDFMHCGRGYSWYNEDEPINDAKAYYARNGIAAFNWHWRDPSRATEEFYTDKTSFDINKIFDEASTEYAAMISDIDYIAGLLKKLQDDDVPVIWRPLHEAAGGWFWWGAKGPQPCKKLWQVMYDRIVNYHGVRNLIWVWTHQPNDDEWYPGDEYVDIVGRDIYKDGDHNSQILEFADMNERYGKKKIVTLSECGSFPDPDKLMSDGAAWSWFMPWYGNFVRDSKYNSLALWQKVMSHEYVITLDEMPDLKIYTATPHEPEPEPNPVLPIDPLKESGLKIYPTVIDTFVTIESQKPAGEIYLIDTMGRIAMQMTLTKSTEVINISNLPSGMYFIKIQPNQIWRIVKK